MRVLGLRARKSRISKLAENFQKRSLELGLISDPNYEFVAPQVIGGVGQQIDAQNKIAGALAALAEFWQNNKFGHINLTSFKDEVTSLESKTARPGELGLENVANNFSRLADLLGAFSTNDWENIATTAKERPTFRSGKLKPETIFFYYLANFGRLAQANLVRWMLPSIQSSLLKDDFLKRARPAPSHFETSVRRLILDREEARRVRNFDEFDRIRDVLIGMGVAVKDSRDPQTGMPVTTWEKISR